MTTHGTQPALSFDTFVETFYSSGVAQFNAGNQEIVYPDKVPPAIITAICERFSKLFNVPVTTHHDSDRHVISMKAMVACNMGKTAKIPRPANAFILYRTHHHQSVKEQHPGIANNDISKIIAAMWKAETDQVKNSWKCKAEEAKDEHARKHPNYQYQPRRPSEKKRRMTKRKLAAIEDAQTQIAAGRGNLPSPRAADAINPENPPPAYIMDFMPMRPDDPMIREFELPTSTSAAKQFEQDIVTYNSIQLLVPVQDYPVLESSFTESVIREQEADISELEDLFGIDVDGALFDHILADAHPQADSQSIPRELWHPAITGSALSARNQENQVRMNAERIRQQRLECEHESTFFGPAR